jgi:hypothetical protein
MTDRGTKLAYRDQDERTDFPVAATTATVAIVTMSP